MKNLPSIILTAALTLALGLSVRSELHTAGQLAVLERQLEYVQMRLEERPEPAPVPVAAARNAAVQPATRATQPAPAVAAASSVAATARVANPDAPPDLAPPATHPAIERGYIYAHDWDDMESALAAMTPAQQRQHWQQVFAAIESGTLEVYDD